MSQSNPTIVDNNSPDIPFYINPQYVNVTDQISTQAYEYVQTAQLSAYNQSLADITTPRWSFSYRFQGTRITVFGVVIPYITGPLPAAQYAVDSSSLTTSSVPNTTRTLTGAKFYTSEYFPFGFHTLTVNVTTATDNAPYLFDYLAIDTTDPPASSSSSSSSATSSFSHTSSSSSPTSSDTALHAQGASTSNAPTGAIVGGVIGGVVLLAAIAIGAWWLWKKNRTYDQSSYAYAKTGQYDGPDPDIHPYTYSTHDASSSHGTHEEQHDHNHNHNQSLYSDAVAPMVSTSGHRPTLPPVSQHSEFPAPGPTKASLAQSRLQHTAPHPTHSDYSFSQPPQSQSQSQSQSHYSSVSQPGSGYQHPQSLSVIAEPPSSSLAPAFSPLPPPLSGAAARKAAEARLDAPRSPEAGGSDLSAVPPPYAP